MFLIFNFFIFLFGLAIGSFLNCVIYRLDFPNFSFLSAKTLSRKIWTGEKNLGEQSRSYCPKCKHTLSWQDLIPVFSFLFLKGNCRYCKKSISIQYPLVELMTGLVFLLIFNFSPFAKATGGQAFANFLFLLIISCFLIIIFVYDLKHYIIPDKVLFPAIAIVFLYRLFGDLVVSRWDLGLGNFILAGLLASAFFLFIFLISDGRWMGFGDVKLAFFMGLFLGYPNILVALFLAFFLGAIIGVGLIVFGNQNLKSKVPFGPFLITGTFIALFYGQEIIQWYTHLFIIV